MVDYTVQEIEMLARHFWDTYVFAPTWDEATEEQRETARDRTRRTTSPIDMAAARLMREAREQGAAEMRERAAKVLDKRIDQCVTDRDRPSTSQRFHEIDKFCIAEVLAARNDILALPLSEVPDARS